MRDLPRGLRWAGALAVALTGLRAMPIGTPSPDLGVGPASSVLPAGWRTALVALEAASGPGARTLREMGCHEVLILDASQRARAERADAARQVGAEHQHPSVPPRTRERAEERTVICLVAAASELTCEAAATALTRATPRAKGGGTLLIAEESARGAGPRCVTRLAPP
jgi:hypothetical protein